MKTRIPASFEELIGNHYGSSDLLDKSNETKVAELFANGYGKPLAPRGQKPPSATLSLRCDDGETLPQRKRRRRGEEYVVFQSSDSSASNDGSAGEEYIVIKGEPPRENFSDVRPNAFPPQPIDARQETQVDVRQPLQAASAPAARTGGNVLGNGQYVAPEQQARPAQKAEPAADKPPLFHKEVHEAQSTKDDFFADMESILTGQKVFDPASRTMVDKDQRGRASSAPRQEEPVPLPPRPTDNGQAIFDRIAQSMQYANAYDLGTVEMETRFVDFDRKQDRKTEAKKTRAGAPIVGQSLSGRTANTTDFLRDLDTIRQQHGAMSVAPSHPVEVRAASNAPSPALSRPFYDTGEHVLTGGDLYADLLHVGMSPGVPYSYGQIIAMGDLYETFAEMMGTDVAEMKQVKELIESSTRYYKSNKADASADVSSERWNKATNGRYMRLALDNFEHFSPNLMLLGKAGMSSAYAGRDHKAAWENHHLAALEEAAKMSVQFARQSFFPEKALIINAFGDHFLTDAFAAGHAINKGEMSQIFRTNFYSKVDELNAAGKAFFEKVASRAWHGRIITEFSKLEPSDFQWYGPIPVGHPNINDADRFASVLKGIAERVPDQAINIVVKALHDRLNKDGIEVFNTAGDGAWRLTGDGRLDVKNLGIVRKAVQQSHDNVIEVAQGMHVGSPVNNTSPMQTTPVIHFEGLFARVWRHVPQLTPASHTLMQKLVREYTDPKSDTLIAAAAQLIEEQLDLLLKLILESRALRKE